MVNIQPLEALKANYSAVNMRVNDPKTTVPEGFKPDVDDSGIYNAVNVEVNRPTVEIQKESVYNYPRANDVVTYDMAGIAPVNVPKLPANTNAYKVPEPNFTTPEAEKELAFHGINFKAAPAQNKQIEIVPAEEIKPEIDIQDVTEKLADADYDKQVMQMVEIVNSKNDKEKLNSYIAPEVFTALINIIQKDTSALAHPTEEQNSAREKLKENLIALEKAIDEGKDPKEFQFPVEMSNKEKELAISLSEFEMAERNKPYAISVTALLAKAYADDVQAQTGNIIPITDLPGSAEMVNILRHDKNISNKLTVIDALKYIAKPEYKEDILAVLTLASRDEDPRVAQYAALAAASLTEPASEQAA